MPAAQVCQKFLQKSLSHIHAYRRDALISMSMTLVRGASLTLTSIGRYLPGTAKVKHKIKRVDRLLANPRLQNDIPELYCSVSRHIISTLSHLIIAIDWSACWRQEFQMLRASLLFEGRAIPLLNRIETLKQQGNHDVHVAFLNELKRIIGPYKSVVIVTDAGYQSPWFNHVKDIGWDFVGRIRGNVHSYLDCNERWENAETLTASASKTPKALGTGLLNKTRKSQIRGHFYTYKAIPKKRRTKRVKYGSSEKEYRRSGKAAWLIFSSIGTDKARVVINIYGKRMQIEQNFRDEKNPRFGFGWRHSGTTGIARLNVLCLLSMIASVITWFIGYLIELSGKHHSYQANTIKTRRVLSFQTLARNVLRHEPDLITAANLFSAFNIWQKNYDVESYW